MVGAEIFARWWPLACLRGGGGRDERDHQYPLRPGRYPGRECVLGAVLLGARHGKVLGSRLLIHHNESEAKEGKS